MASSLQADLNKFSILFPGRKSGVPFSDRLALENFLNTQYPNWDSHNKVSSVPIAREPRLFLKQEVVPDFFKDRFKCLYLGEEGEIELYDALLSLNGNEAVWNNAGVLLFSSINGNELFGVKNGRFEIDLLLLHPRKGVLLMEAKNRNNHIRKNNVMQQFLVKEAAIQDIADYASDDTDKIPVYFYVYSKNRQILRGSKNDDLTKTQTTQNIYQVFYQNELHDPDYWSQEISSLPSISSASLVSKIRYFGAKLCALHSLEDGSFIERLHHKFASLDIQGIRASSKSLTPDQYVREQTKGSVAHESIDQLQAIIEPLKEISLSKTKAVNSVILWTQQLEILCRVILQSSGPGPCRFLIAGPKGSGKTVIMLQIARLMACLEKTKILVSTSRGVANMLIKARLKEYLDGVGMSNVDFAVRPKDFLDYDVFLVDEVEAFKNRGQLRYSLYPVVNDLIQSTQKEDGSKMPHLFLFSSDVNAEQTVAIDFPFFQILHLQHSLRSTTGIAKFCERFRESFQKLQPNPNQHFPIRLAHNLASASPNVIAIATASQDMFHTDFVQGSAEAVIHAAEISGRSQILVTFLTHAISMARILSLVSKKDFSISIVSWENGKTIFSNYDSGSKEDCSDARIVVAYGSVAEGAEFAAVVVVYDPSMLSISGQFIPHHEMFRAMTRATSHLAVVLPTFDGAVFAPLIRHGLAALEYISIAQISQWLKNFRSLYPAKIVFVYGEHLSVLEEESWIKPFGIRDPNKPWEAGYFLCDDIDELGAILFLASEKGIYEKLGFGVVLNNDVPYLLLAKNASQTPLVLFYCDDDLPKIEEDKTRNLLLSNILCDL